MITLKDANGQYVCIKETDLNQEIVESILFFGLSSKDIISLERMYTLLGGTLPCNDDNIQQLLIGLGTGPYNITLPNG